MAIYSFVKNSFAPLGEIHFALCNDEFVIDDADNDVIVVSDINKAGELRSHQYLIEYRHGTPILNMLPTARLGRYNSMAGNIELGYLGDD